ncbi:MAG: DNA polymerase III subunit beta [Candidatus Geothermincolales bacterium]
MRISCLRDDLVDRLQLALPFTSQRGSLPVLSGAFMEAEENFLTLRTTDLNSFFKTTLPCETEASGKCVVNARLLLDILKDMEEEKLAMRLEDNRLTVEGISSFFHLQTMPWEDFPEEPEKGSTLVEELESSSFSTAIERVSKAASKDEKRPVLTGIFIEVKENNLTLVSTDSYRLSLVRMNEGFKVRGEGEYIIPSQLSSGITRLTQKGDKFDLYGDETGSYVTMKIGDSELKIRLIDGKFPKYEQFIPKDPDKEVWIEKKRLLSSLKRLAHVGNTVKFEFKEGELKISAVSKDVGEAWEVLPVDFRGGDITIAFNGKFIEDGVSSAGGDRIYMGLTDPLKPAIIKGDDAEDYIYLVMPVRL